MKKLLFCLLTVFPFLLSAQSLTPEGALENFSKYPQEKIYIQFDKGDYLAGETMRFKAYVLSGLSLSRISTNLYVECLDYNKRVLFNNLFPLATGIAEGSFFIPRDVPEDVYYIRAYTNWMLNFPETFQFIRPVNIYNPSSLTRLVERPVNWRATVHTEGGMLLDNIEAKVAVRLHALGRLPQQWSGYLFEGADSSKKLSQFTSLNEEIGFFQFFPEYGKVYSIKITDTEGKTQVIQLPAIYNQGAVLKVAPLQKDIAFQVSSKGVANNLAGYKILAQSGGELIYSAVINANKEVVNGTIPMDSSFRGIVHLSLFDPAGHAVSERLCFSGNSKFTAFAPNIQFMKRTSSMRGYNEWKVDVDSLNTDSYLVEVMNASVPEAEHLHDLFSTLWLGDLATVPYKGAWYLSGKDPFTPQALDALLVSEKWARFQWNELLKGFTPKFQFLPDNYLSYHGTATRNKKLLANQEVNMIFQLRDSSKILINIKTDSLGQFTLKNLVFRDTARVYFQANSKKANATNINIDFKRIEPVIPFSLPLPVALYTSVKRTANDSMPQHVKDYNTTLYNKEALDKRYKLLETVTVKSKARSPKEELNKKLSSGMFQDMNEVVFDFVNEDQDLISSNILEWLSGRVAGVTMNGIRGQKPKIYIDEMLDDDGLRLATLSPSDIAMIKVMKTSFLLGGPAIAVYTLRGGMKSKMSAAPILPSNTVVGYPVINRFKGVSAHELADNTNQDTRSILYWNTTLQPEKGKETIQFYNNDISDKLRMIVIGFTNDGTPVYLNQEVSL